MLREIAIAESPVPAEFQQQGLTRRELLRNALVLGAGVTLASALRGVPGAQAAPSSELIPGGIIPGNGFEILDNNGVVIVSVPYGIDADIRGRTGIDLADHGIFRNSVGGPHGLVMEAGHPNVVRNVLGEPGGFLADKAHIQATEPQNLAAWDAKVAAKLAEYMVKPGQGPDVNTYVFEKATDYGLVAQPDGTYIFPLILPAQRLVRIDCEEAWIFLFSQNGDQDMQIDLLQAGTAENGFPRAHHTLFIRTSYGQQVRMEMRMVTYTGTMVQIVGDYPNKVKDPTAFFSEESHIKGVYDRQGNAEIPRVITSGANMNDRSFGTIETSSLGVPHVNHGSNYS